MTQFAADSGTSLYERMGERTTQPFALRVLDELGAIANRSVIDIAAGTGGLAVAAAERGAFVTATDVSAAMVKRAAERLLPFQGSRAQIEDFRALTIPDAQFDVSISIFGVLAFATWRQGIAEMARVTRRGGQIALAMWTHGDDCSPAHVMRRAFRNTFPERELWPADLFPLFSENSLTASAREAGLVGVEVQVATAEWCPFSSADVVRECDPMFKGFPGYSALVTHETVAMHKALAEAFQSYADAHGIIRLPTKAFVVHGRKA